MVASWREGGREGRREGGEGGVPRPPLAAFFRSHSKLRGEAWVRGNIRGVGVVTLNALTCVHTLS